MKLAAPVILLLAILLAIATFDAVGPPAGFVMVQGTDAFTLDPQKMSWQQDIRLARAIYETLSINDPDNGGTLPGAAERWERSDDGLRWTFRLRPDARWSNGDPVTAADFAYAWRRAMLPDFASDYAGFVADIAGAQELWDWREARLKEFTALPAAERTAERAARLWTETNAKADALVQVRTPDERTIELTLRRRVPYFLSVAAFPVMAPVHRATVERFSGFDLASGRRTVDPEWTKPGNIVCNGPYVVQDWRYKRRMRLARNPFHRESAGKDVDTIDIVPIEDNNTSVLAYEAGGADWVTDVRVAYRPELAEQGARYAEHHRAEFDRLRAGGASVDEALAALPAPTAGERRDVHVIPNFGTDFYSFNCRPTLGGGGFNPFADAHVRRAFALSVDKRALAERVIRIGEPVASTLVPPGSIKGYPSPKGLGFDPARARQELAAAGWTGHDADGTPTRGDGTRFPTVDVLYSTASPRYRDLSLAMADMWRRELGVPVETTCKDSKFLKEDLRAGNYMIARGGWYGDYVDPTTFLDLSRTGDGNNDRGYTSPEYDAMLDRAAAEPDPAKRMQLLAEAERKVVEEDLPILPTTHYATMLLFDPVRIRGITRDPSFDQRLSNVRVLAPR
jgi:oligopeptide transport system substrate-binding protein